MSSLVTEEAVGSGSTNSARCPLVSVLMSVRNAGESLRPAVLSVLAQSHRDLELIVIDDGCTDGCLETIADIRDDRIQRLSRVDSGKAVALNLALERAEGEFFATQEAEDFSHPRRLERQVECLLANPDVAAVFTGMDLILDGRRVAPAYPGRTREECARAIETMKVPALDPTGMYRRSLCDHLEFAPELRVGQVYDFILRVGEEHPMLVLPECLYSYRFHWNSVTKTSPELRNACIDQVFARALSRRGKAPSCPALPGALSALSRRVATNRMRDNNLASTFINSVIDARRRGQWALSVRTGFACLLLHPLDLHYHKAFLFSLVPRRVLEWLDRRHWLAEMRAVTR